MPTSVTCPRTSAFSVDTMALLNGGSRHAYSTTSTPTSATAAKPMADSHCARRSGGAGGGEAAATAAAAAAAATVAMSGGAAAGVDASGGVVVIAIRNC